MVIRLSPSAPISPNYLQANPRPLLRLKMQPLLTARSPRRLYQVSQSAILYATNSLHLAVAGDPAMEVYDGDRYRRIHTSDTSMSGVTEREQASDAIPQVADDNTMHDPRSRTTARGGSWLWSRGTVARPEGPLRGLWTAGGTISEQPTQLCPSLDNG